jgi:hypothetical protein
MLESGNSKYAVNIKKSNKEKNTIIILKNFLYNEVSCIL